MSNNSRRITCFVSLALVFIFQSTIPCRAGLLTQLFPTHEVRIQNGLSGNQVLGVHCQSPSGVDLEIHHVPQRGAFNFSFGRHSFGPGLFLCLIWKHNAHFEFEIMDDNVQFQYFCEVNTCTWRAQDDAIYRYKNGGLLRFYANWSSREPEILTSRCKT